MNPWALLVILIGVMLVIIGVKGTQHDIAAAITGKASGTPADAGGSSGTVGGPKTGNTNTQKNQNPVPAGGAA